jgi:secreted trypsin-like serine protease
VVGGEIAAAGQFPWMVSIRELRDGPLFHYCGGSILSENWVLTAAQCCDTLPRFYHVVAGDYDSFVDEATEEHVGVTR